MKMPGDSFTFGTINSFEEWGIKVIAYDVFSASKRDRKQVIPFRDGTHDFGRKYYNNKIVRLDCATETDQIPSKALMCEVIYHMSQRNRLRLWDEQDKYYMGELIDTVDVKVLPKYQKQIFVLPIVCDPFAYGESKLIKLHNGMNEVDYFGTAETPTMIVIRNPNNFAVSNISVTAIQQNKA